MQMKIHVVQYGDNLWSISQKYGAAINQIVLLNSLPNANQLIPGEALMIPELHKEYVVSQGDTLSSISHKNGVQLSELQAINQISNPSSIYPGELLILPSFPYAIQSSDTIWKIAQKFNISLQSILQYNHLQPTAILSPGQILKIPAHIRPEVEVNAYTTTTTESERQNVLKLAQYFTYLSPFTHAVTSDGIHHNIGH